MRVVVRTAIVLVALIGGALPARSEDDTREMVKLPEMMQAHMLSNMRDHLRTLDGVMGLLADGKVGEAGRLAEARLGMSSLELHGAAHMAPFMPEPMATAGTEMHRLASRFAEVAENADVEHTYESQQKVFGALRDVLRNCNACHTAYRIH